MNYFSLPPLEGNYSRGKGTRARAISLPLGVEDYNRIRCSESVLLIGGSDSPSPPVPSCSILSFDPDNGMMSCWRHNLTTPIDRAIVGGIDRWIVATAANGVGSRTQVLGPNTGGFGPVGGPPRQPLGATGAAVGMYWTLCLAGFMRQLTLYL